MDLKDLMVNSKAVWVDFPGLKGFKVEIANLSRKEITKMRKDCLTQKFDRKSRQVIDTFDEDKFINLFCEKTIKGWKGLTLEHLQALVLVDIGDNDPTTELDYSPENAVDLVLNSVEFDNWLNEVVQDLDNFRD